MPKARVLDTIIQYTCNDFDDRFWHKCEVIWGENDPYINVGVARNFMSHLKHASLHLVPAGHWLQIDEPEQVAKEMLA
jgi:pimeloyl-ACP methyl ester carboxylesterase